MELDEFAVLTLPLCVAVHGCLWYMGLRGTMVPTLVPPAVAPAMDPTKNFCKGAAAHSGEYLGTILKGQVSALLLRQHGGSVSHEQALSNAPALCIFLLRSISVSC